MTFSRMVRQFHEKFEVPVRDYPCLPVERIALRKELIREECQELFDALDARDIVEVADAIADLHYVISGAALEFGIPEDEVFHEVHRSNMSKAWADGLIHRREDGKVIKSPDYSPANIAPILQRHSEPRP